MAVTFMRTYYARGGQVLWPQNIIAIILENGPIVLKPVVWETGAVVSS